MTKETSTVGGATRILVAPDVPLERVAAAPKGPRPVPPTHEGLTAAWPAVRSAIASLACNTRALHAHFAVASAWVYLPGGAHPQATPVRGVPYQAFRTQDFQLMTCAVRTPGQITHRSGGGGETRVQYTPPRLWATLWHLRPDPQTGAVRAEKTLDWRVDQPKADQPGQPSAPTAPLAALAYDLALNLYTVLSVPAAAPFSAGVVDNITLTGGADPGPFSLTTLWRVPRELAPDGVVDPSGAYAFVPTAAADPAVRAHPAAVPVFVVPEWEREGAEAPPGAYRFPGSKLLRFGHGLAVGDVPDWFGATVFVAPDARPAVPFVTVDGAVVPVRVFS